MHLRSIGVLIASNLLGGVGVASGAAVGALLAEELGSTAVAGLAQASSVLGAAVAAVPLATLAARKGRRRSLALGYAIATIGAVGILLAAVVGQYLVLLAALGLFGVAQAVNLQSRYAAADNAPVASRARTMSIVIWATTVGSVAGPNLTAPGDRLGVSLGLPALVGPYLFAVVSFAAAALVIALLFRPVDSDPHAGRGSGNPATAADAPGGSGAVAVGGSAAVSSGGAGGSPSGGTPAGASGVAASTDHGGSTARPAEPAPAVVGAVAALRWAASHAVARYAVVLIACAHAVMVMVMVMTPLHMQHNGMSLELVGIVISLHVLGMFAFSPLWGWAVDRFGAVRTAVVGMAIQAGSVAGGYIAASGSSTLTMVALVALGLGWSGCVIAASDLLAGATPERVRVPLQGATDAGMNYAGAGAAALAGPILAMGGFHAVNIAAAVILVPAIACLVPVLRRRPPAEELGEPLAADDVSRSA